ncbi:hypothetical protein MTR67_004254 [Solanum verrucosum]|uniref:Uncharacterized protein n=1 Tax=Solanum verrucosum TaxID=315347 RepID=A0AAF0TAE1_SOLVR|nr:hypothetical protein MTR67_004254 [Solanum verrucosum]
MWKKRNLRCFEDKCSSTQGIKMKCLALFYFWCKLLPLFLITCPLFLF